MSSTLKLWLAILVVGLGLTVTVVWLSWSLSTARESLAGTQVQVQALSATVEALQAQAGRVQAGINNLNQRSAENDRRVQNALRQNPDWASEPVPPAVSDSLCKFVLCPDGDPPG